jgi:hypothetical protein
MKYRIKVVGPDRYRPQYSRFGLCWTDAHKVLVEGGEYGVGEVIQWLEFPTSLAAMHWINDAINADLEARHYPYYIAYNGNWRD